MAIRAGQLNTRGRIERPVETPDGAGGATVAWTIVGDVWMEVTPLSGREAWTIQHAQPTATHRIAVRYRTDLVAGMRIVLNNVAYRILTPPLDVNFRHEELHLTCEQYAAGVP